MDVPDRGSPTLANGRPRAHPFVALGEEAVYNRVDLAGLVSLRDDLEQRWNATWMDSMTATPPSTTALRRNTSLSHHSASTLRFYPLGPVLFLSLACLSFLAT